MKKNKNAKNNKVAKSGKKVSKEAKVDPYFLVMYVQDASSRIKKFDSSEKVAKFIKDFQKDYPEYMSGDSDNWIDFVVTNIIGDVYFFTDGLRVER